MKAVVCVRSSEQEAATNTKEIDGMTSTQQSSSVRNRNRNNTGVGMMKKNIIPTLVAVVGMVVAVGMGGNASAALITGETIEDFSSEYAFAGGKAVSIINDSGLSEDGSHDGDKLNMWRTYTTDPLPVHITIDLEANYNLGSVHVWNYNDYINNQLEIGSKDVAISVADTVGGAFTKLDDFVFTIADGTSTYKGETFDLSGYAAANDVRLVRFDITTNYGAANNTGLSEVQFYQIPEPASFLLLILGGFGLIFRRPRRR